MAVIYRTLTRLEVETFVRWIVDNPKEYEEFQYDHVLPDPDFPGNLVKFVHPLTHDHVQTTEFLLNQVYENFVKGKQ